VNVDADLLRREIEAVLSIGAALPDGTPGALRLRAHRFLRGGWRFHRCLNPACGRLFPMGEERCACGHLTAPLYLCRACGADYVRLVGDPLGGPLRAIAGSGADQEWLVFEHGRFDDLDLGPDEDSGDEDGQGGTLIPTGPRGRKIPKQIRKRPVLRGSIDPSGLVFSANENDYSLKVMLAPARTRCLCCGGTAGSRSILTPVSLGTSAAVKVMAEGVLEALETAARAGSSGDGKQRLLIFSDSRQDAAHQARFIIFASRYDRMRRALVRLLERDRQLSIQRAVELLGERAVHERDNPFVPEETGWLQSEALARIRAYEEAPLLDDLAITAGYRGTVFNLGLAGVRYDRLAEYIAARGGELAGRLGLTVGQLEYVCRCLLDDMRVRGAVSRELLRYHPDHPSYPDHGKAARWERRIAQPMGFACNPAGKPLAHLDPDAIPQGIKLHNAWRKAGAGGSGPRLERVLKSLMERFGGVVPDEHVMVACLKLLRAGTVVVPSVLFGYTKTYQLLQVNAESIRVVLLDERDRRRCGVCGSARAFAGIGSPCPLCHGQITTWPDEDVVKHRSVRRIRAERTVALVAGEHTAQVPNATRMELEAQFKAPPATSAVNVLACSPTLEMGIDVGGLDAVALPQRPDNYAQRGGRAGRRTRVGLVLGYARSTPHDQYFYDKPAEMIAGEVPAPALALGNRDVLLRHVSAIVFSSAEPGLDGRMVKYVSPTGEIRTEAVEALIAGLVAQFEPGLALARTAFGDEVLAAAALDEQTLRQHLETIPERVRDVVNRTARQVIELRQALDAYTAQLVGRQAATRAGDLVARLLGIATERQAGVDADDRSAGYPLRRFAEFGILPGYEFPTEPASLRLLGDKNEEEPVTVARRFGIAQFQPDASVFARTGRWRVMGLDTASPWNPRGDAPAWLYRLCRSCGLRFASDHPRCPRCECEQPAPCLPAAEFGGFVARRNESPVMDEEERFAVRNLVRANPQWDGEVVGRWDTAGAWALRLSRGEEVRWLNEGVPIPDGKSEPNALHASARGYLLCGSCGRMLSIPEPAKQGRGTPRPRGNTSQPDQFGHRADCPNAGVTPKPLAIVTSTKAEVLRLLAPVPPALSDDDVKPWALSLGYALRTGIRQLYMLDGPEIEFEFEGPWRAGRDEPRTGMVSLSFIDGSLGGTGYLSRVAAELHLVARRALEHLDHPGCDTACYRCLKSYANQRFHEHLRWPLAAPSLEALASEPTLARPLHTGDLNDPGPWLEAFATGVGSPLELKFLRLFEQHDFHPMKQVPIAPGDEGRPISIADFAVPAVRLAIYVDGAAFHVGANLRRDRAIRERLRQGTPAWRVEELRAADLAGGANLVRRLVDSVQGL
jgi:hypothetical protein